MQKTSEKFTPSTPKNRRQRRAPLNSYGIHKPERKNLLIVVGQTKFRNFIQKIRFFNKETNREELRKINHFVAVH